ncbi:MAG TPA: 2-oxoglutarate dehydrogenase, E2 component, dihydrolipoamide succinyltransferase, partial [Vicinamibacteria bacterium]|nr:2-oxoglutarate dehydrogenase, E2 component, dihydrolipoamide succinyltransferase [Vicinamibacteria bacterium]
MHPIHVLALVAALAGTPQKPRAKPAAPAPAAPAPAAADPVQKLIDTRALEGAYNPVLLRYLAEE